MNHAKEIEGDNNINSAQLENQKINNAKVLKANIIDEMQEKFKTLFTDPTRANMVCNAKSEEEVDPKDKLADEKQLHVSGVNVEIPKKKIDRYSLAKLGWDSSAYLFDYLDPVVLAEFSKAANEIFDEVFKTDAKDYDDPYDIKKMLPNTVGDETILISELKKLSPSFDGEVWKHSVTIGQIAKNIFDWKWEPNVSVLDPAKFFVDKYDFNGDGRLSRKEFTIGNIRHNKKILASGKITCTHCFEKLGETLNIIFSYADCNKSGLVNAEQLWNGLHALKRQEGDNRNTDYDMYKCQLDDGHYRTSAVNDFIIKAHKSVEARLSMQEFITGILQGLWDRQVTDSKIFADDSRSMRSLRWESKDTDTQCKRITEMRQNMGKAQ
jgi:hypothetical protein